ncbi:MAG TPA: ABC-2 family transporter protein [Patescibacteria group bacterium]|nr:ABC-2 family transporter protein [Patescibacteria group bacterium]
MISRILKVYFYFLSQNLKKEMIYRTNFLMFLVFDILGTMTVVIFFKIIFNENKLIAGWDFESTLILIGTVGLVRQLSFLTFREGFGMLGHIIPKGRFDLVLTKPFSSQFLVAFEDITIIEGFGEGLLGLVLIIYGAVNSNASITVLSVLFFLLFVICSYVLYYSFTLMINSLAFWVNRTQGLQSLVYNFLDMALYPRDILRGFGKIIFTFIIPISIVATVPAQALMGNLKIEMAAILFTMTIIFFTLANFIWRKGIRRYESASS